jgi:hypothetical protein
MRLRVNPIKRDHRCRVRLATVSVAVATALALAACGGSARSTTSTVATKSTHTATTTLATSTAAPVKPRPKPPSHPTLTAAALGTSPTQFVPAVRWRGQTAVWIARSPSGVGLLSFNQDLVVLRLHSGTIDAGGSGWRFGSSVDPREQRLLVAGFNGGFKFSTGAGGFVSYGRIGAPLRSGLGSIVTYANGRTDIGAWHAEVPAPGHRIVSVRQNLNLLIDHGSAAPSASCDSCWGATLGGVSDPARSALGITASGRLVWAGGEHLTVTDLVHALMGAGVVRAVELDINPEWVAGYLYGHRGGHGPLAPQPVVPGQPGTPGQFLAPYSRDFFTVDAR